MIERIEQSGRLGHSGWSTPGGSRVHSLADNAVSADFRTMLLGKVCDAFQKVRCDHQVVLVFDGSTPVNRGVLIRQIPKVDTRLRRACCRPGRPARGHIGRRSGRNVSSSIWLLGSYRAKEDTHD